MTEQWHLGDTGQFDSLIANFANHPMRGGLGPKRSHCCVQWCRLCASRPFGRKLLGTKGPTVSNQNSDLVS
jgi:hypothetical protein